MTRKCSHCNNNGHNSRTCPNKGGVKLFGVRLTDGSIKKSASMGNLSSAQFSSSSSLSSLAASPQNPSRSPSDDPLRDSTPVDGGYVSDDPTHTSCSSNCRGERKKGVPWTEEEHKLFLLGLQKLGKGDWRGIARNFVISRTPTQVASHAQKYFIRQMNATRRKRRSSLFDMVPEMSMGTPSVPEEPEPFLLHCLQPSETEHVNLLPPVHLSLDTESEPMETTLNETPIEAEEAAECSNLPPMIPAFYPIFIPIPFPFLPQNLSPAEEVKVNEISQHEILKPKPIFSKDITINTNELMGMSKLTLGESGAGHMQPSSFSLKLIGNPSRQSAFHANPPVNGSNLSKSKSNAIHAV